MITCFYDNSEIKDEPIVNIDRVYWASVEPSGLQIAGTLRSGDWNEWEGKFNELIGVFPFFEC